MFWETRRHDARIRGATQVDADDRDLILEATRSWSAR